MIIEHPAYGTRKDADHIPGALRLLVIDATDITSAAYDELAAKALREMDEHPEVHFVSQFARTLLHDMLGLTRGRWARLIPPGLSRPKIKAGHRCKALRTIIYCWCPLKPGKVFRYHDQSL